MISRISIYLLRFTDLSGTVANQKQQRKVFHLGFV